MDHNAITYFLREITLVVDVEFVTDAAADKMRRGPFILTQWLIIGPHKCQSSMATGTYDMIACYNSRTDLLIYGQIQLDYVLTL